MEIKLENVYYEYANHAQSSCPVLQDITLTISSNQSTSIIGRSGSGKSTLVKIMKGLLIPTKGVLKIDDVPMVPKKKGKSIIVPDIGLVFQYPEHQLFETTVLRDLSFGPMNHGWKQEIIIQTAKQMIELVGLNESYFDKSPLQLSGGEKRRVAIACVLMMNPKVLILDEPTAGLDPYGRKLILDIVDKWRKGGERTVIFITHQMNDVVEYSDEVIVLDEGKLLYQMDSSSFFQIHGDHLQNMGLMLPETAELLQVIAEKTGQNIEVSSLKEESVVRHIVSLLTGQGVSTYGR